jgi:hypothetical protein
MYPAPPPTPSCAGNLARPPCPENSSLRSHYARHNATGFVEHLARPDHAREGHILAPVGSRLLSGRVVVPHTPLVIGAISTQGVAVRDHGQGDSEGRVHAGCVCTGQ